MSNELPDDLVKRIGDDIKRYYEGEGEQGFPGLRLLLREWAYDLQAARKCARESGGVCPHCGDSYAQRVADDNGEPNALWECTRCHERYYTHTDSIAESYYYMKNRISRELGFEHGAFPKQLYEWIENHKEKKQ